MAEACQSTRHCADYGWCHRCDPELAALMGEVNKMIGSATRDDSIRSELYAGISTLLHTADSVQAAAGLAEARRTNQALNRRAQAAESIVERYAQAIRNWKVNEKGTYVPYESLKEIGKLSGVEIMPHVRYMQRFENARQAEEFVERIYGLLEYWNALTAPFGPPQSWWWEERRAELSDVLAGRGMPGVQDSLRGQVKTALDAAGVTVENVADRLNLSNRHVEQMLNGKVVLTIGWAEQMLALCGQRLEIRAVSAIPAREGEQP